MGPFLFAVCREAPVLNIQFKGQSERLGVEGRERPFRLPANLLVNVRLGYFGRAVPIAGFAAQIGDAMGFPIEPKRHAIMIIVEFLVDVFDNLGSLFQTYSTHRC